MFISEALAQTAPAPTVGVTDSMFGSITGMLPLILMFVVLYFVMIRPQMKRQKEHKAMIEALAKGDEIVTSGGLLGKVTKVGETFVGIEVTNGVELQLQRSAVVQVLPKGTFGK
ncbi:preprotein translocase subunit YajC [soil metagenome]